MYPLYYNSHSLSLTLTLTTTSTSSTFTMHQSTSYTQIHPALEAAFEKIPAPASASAPAFTPDDDCDDSDYYDRAPPPSITRVKYVRISQSFF